MKIPTACRQCRSGKRKCIRSVPGATCIPCQKKNIKCSGAADSTGFAAPVQLLPKTGDNESRRSAEPADLSFGRIKELVGIYLTKIHDKLHSLFHIPTLRSQIQDGSVNEAVLYAICSMGSKFATDPDTRMLEAPLTAKSKGLLLADLENISLENVQACIIVACMNAWQGNNPVEALFYRIAHSMAEIMGLDSPLPTDSAIVCEVKRRVLWTLFLADRTCFSGLGLPQRMSDFNNTLDLPMDEDIFYNLNADEQTSIHQWKPGLWAHMATLARLLGPILDLNRQVAQGNVKADVLDQIVNNISLKLEAWLTMLPQDDQMSQANLYRHQRRGRGSVFLSVHMCYNYYVTLLYFRFLELRNPAKPYEEYATRCKRHASAFSSLLRLSRQMRDCDTVCPIAGHMAAVCSSVLVHTLLFGNMEEVEAARFDLTTNFEAMVELKSCWPAVHCMIHRLVTFQNICLLSSDSSTHALDGWMVRYLIDFSLPLQERKIQVVPPNLDTQSRGISFKAQELSRQGRYTEFGEY